MLGELCAPRRVGMFLVELGVLSLTVAFALSTAGESCHCKLTVLGLATLLHTLLEFAALVFFALAVPETCTAGLFIFECLQLASRIDMLLNAPT